MTEFELAEIFISYVEMALTYFMAFISATSAIVVVAHMVGGEMTRALANVVILIYTVASLYLGASFERVTNAVIVIRDQMDPTLTWHPAVTEPQWVLKILYWSGVGATIVLYTTAMWYFFHVRKN